MKLASALAVLSLVSMSPVRADVLVLEEPGAGPFTRLQTAIDFAPEGATLLLGPGEYEAFWIDGKSLTLIGLETGPHAIRGSSRVEGLAPDQQVVLRGLLLEGAPSLDVGELALEIVDCAGVVRLEACQVLGGAGLADIDDELWGAGGGALRVSASSNVGLCNSLLRGGDGGSGGQYYGTGGDGGAGVVALQSGVALYDVDCIGGLGGFSGTEGGRGGPGYVATSGGVFASGSAFVGGDGGDALDFLAAQGGDGGDGLYLSLTAAARLLDNVYIGGQGGDGLGGPEYDGQDGRPLFWEGGPVSELPGAARTLRALTPVVGDDDSWSLRFEGEPGDEVFAMTSAGHGFRYTIVPIGVWLVPFHDLTSVRAMPAGVVSGSGTLDFALKTPALLGLPGQRFTVQAFVRAGGALQPMSGSVQLLVLDADGLADCDANGRSDILDLLDGVGVDCDGNLVPDACDFLPDCNGNGVGDGIDIDCGDSQDTNGNGVPDECEQGVIWYVDDDAVPGGDGSLGAPFRSLREAFLSAFDGSSIRVFPGSYTGPANRSLDCAGRVLDVASLSGPATCVIDCGGAGRAFWQSGGNSAPAVRIEGFTVQNGTADSSTTSVQYGGGAYFEGTATLVDCRFVHCTAAWGGGAVAGSFLTLEGCTFEGNTAPSTGSGNTLGGALHAEGQLSLMDCSFVGNHADLGGAVDARGPIQISRCTFESNSAITGGAVWFNNPIGSPLLAHCVFQGNSAVEYGGAIAQIALGSQTVTVDNGFFAFNEAAAGGAISLRFAGRLLLTSSTFAANDALDGPALELAGRDAEIHNSILWGNSGTPIRFATGPAYHLTVSYSDVEGGPAGVDLTQGTLDWGAGNLDADPLFVNPVVGDYRLGAGSPCLDAGSVAELAPDYLDVDGDGDSLEAVPLDLLLAPRRVDDPAPDAGAGAPPLPDMGSLERG